MAANCSMAEWVEPPHGAASETVFVGRQPIYNRRLDVVAYELLFRNGAGTIPDVVDGDEATSKVITGALVEIGLNHLVGERPAYIKFSRNFLIGRYPIPRERDRIVIEVRQDELDDQTLPVLRKLAGEGYRLVLDGCRMDRPWRPFAELADVIKVDLPATDQRLIRARMEEFRDYDAALLAGRIETFDEFQFCKELGFDLYQGFFLAQPQTLTARTVPYNQMAILRLVARLQDPSAGFAEIEQAVCEDVTLSYKLLRYINSASVGLPRRVDSIRQALVLLGFQRLRTLATMVILAGINEKPLALMETAMLRAKMCELLARETGRDDPETFFTVGLLSTLDAILDCPMDRVLRELPLSDNVQDALLHLDGALGAALQCVLAYERGEWDQVRFLQVSPAKIRDAFSASAAWIEKERGAFV